MNVTVDQKINGCEAVMINGLDPNKNYRLIEVPEENPLRQVAAKTSLALNFVKECIAINPLKDGAEENALEEVAAQLYRLNERYLALGYHKKSEDFSEDESIIF